METDFCISLKKYIAAIDNITKNAESEKAAVRKNAESRFAEVAHTSIKYELTADQIRANMAAAETKCKEIDLKRDNDIDIEIAAGEVLIEAKDAEVAQEVVKAEPRKSDYTGIIEEIVSKYGTLDFEAKNDIVSKLKYHGNRKTDLAAPYWFIARDNLEPNSENVSLLSNFYSKIFPAAVKAKENYAQFEKDANMFRATALASHWNRHQAELTLPEKIHIMETLRDMDYLWLVQ